jgi:hypothetical protein
MKERLHTRPDAPTAGIADPAAHGGHVGAADLARVQVDRQPAAGDRESAAAWA